MKFGVEIPGTIEEEVSLKENNSNTLWKNCIVKETKNSRIAFKLLERHGKIPFGYTYITCHLVFDLKLYMTRKSQCVAVGCLTDLPTHITY